MGLRIGTNLGALSALRNLQQSGRAELTVLERLATGRQINRAADNPAGLVQLQALTSESVRLQAAIESTQRGSSLVNVADAALGEISNILVDLRGAATRALNSNSPSEQQALQQYVDQGVAAINRIAGTTRFADQSLLNGNFAFNLTGTSPELERVNVRSVDGAVPFPRSINVNVISEATQGQATGTVAATQAGDATFRVQGNLGTQEITVQAGATQAEVAQAINSVSAFTGVIAIESGVDAGKIRSSEVGSDQLVRVENVTGTLDGITEGLTFGTDVVGSIDGQTAEGRGNTLSVRSSTLDAEVTVEGGTTGNFSFTIQGGGARFQIGAGVTDSVVLGIPNVGAAELGLTAGLGALNQLVTGGSASLQTSAANASNILGAAGNEISTLRASLGSFQSNLLGAQERALGVQLENITSARSKLGDADFAEQTAALTRTQLLRQSGVNVLRQANLAAGSVLRLLQG